MNDYHLHLLYMFRMFSPLTWMSTVRLNTVKNTQTVGGSRRDRLVNTVSAFALGDALSKLSPSYNTDFHTQSDRVLTDK
jgi:hypothetical protein